MGGVVLPNQKQPTTSLVGRGSPVQLPAARRLSRLNKPIQVASPRFDAPNSSLGTGFGDAALGAEALSMPILGTLRGAESRVAFIRGDNVTSHQLTRGRELARGPCGHRMSLCFTSP